MICARGKTKPRILKLTLRCGAGKRVWAPLVLHWRRRSRTKEIRSDRRPPITTQTFLTQNYFYFVTHANSSGRYQPNLRTFPTTRIQRERVTTDRHWANSVKIQNTSLNTRSSSFTTLAAGTVKQERVMFYRTRADVVTVNRLLESRRDHHRSSINYVSRRTPPGLIVERTESLTRLQSVSPSMTRVHSRPSSAERLVFRRVMRREELTRLKTYGHTREYQTRIFTSRAQTPEPLRHRSPSQNKSTRLLVDSSEELVWRRTHNEITNHLNTSGVVERRSVSATVDETPTQTVSPSLNRPAPLRITQLDPALVDRLTDDVIRRVEQRARIERQRRGL